jgi:hypothetical protein
VNPNLYLLYFAHYPMHSEAELRHLNGDNWVNANKTSIANYLQMPQKLINDINHLAKDGRLLLQTIITPEQMKHWERWLELTDITKHVLYARGPIKNRNHKSSPPRLYFTLFDIPEGGIHAVGV